MNDINKNMDVVRSFTLNKGIYVIEYKSKITHLNVKGNGNLRVVLKDDFGSKKENDIELEFNMTAPENHCLGGIEIHVMERIAFISFKQHIGFSILEPHKIFKIDRRKLLI